ncbi:hypothetical protein Plhal710r2_c087g0182541 [Plasmopara halstedii]
MGSMRKGISGVPLSIFAILNEHKAFLHGLSDTAYTFHSPLVDSSVGQHTRHSLDHLRKPIELLASCQQKGGESVVHYDIRDRHTLMEKDRQVAIEHINQLKMTICTVPQSDFLSPVRAAFMLSPDGSESIFNSSFDRELAFAVHHYIHHNAISKMLLRHHFPEQHVPIGFGMAPSTSNYMLERLQK